MLARLIASVLAGEAGEILDRARVAAILYVLALLAGLTSLGFFIGAAYVAVAEATGSLLASIYFGAGFLVLTVIILIWQRIASRMRVRRAERRRASDVRALASTAAIVLLPSLLARKGTAIGLLAPLLAAVGYAIYRENRGSKDDEDDEED